MTKPTKRKPLVYWVVLYSDGNYAKIERTLKAARAWLTYFEREHPVYGPYRVAKFVEVGK